MPKLKRLGIAVLCLAWLTLGACTTTASHRWDIPGLQGQPELSLPDQDPLEISPAMKAFVETWERNRAPTDNRAWSLAYAALDPYNLNFRYDPMVTLTARDAFEQKTGNCLTFSNLIVALAREAGLDAWYREVQVLPEWSNLSDMALVSMHTNAVVQHGSQQIAVDVSQRRRAAAERVRRLSDREAKAQHYNNLGAEALVKEDLARAHAWFSKALATRPGLAYVWSNLGVVYRRNGQEDDAIRAYEHALAIEPEHSVSLNNLYVIYKDRGDYSKAAELAASVERIRRRNPYFLLHLAQVANDAGAYTEAAELLERAIRMNRAEYRFHRELAITQYLLGDPTAARASLETARRLAPAGVNVDSFRIPEADVRPDS